MRKICPDYIDEAKVFMFTNIDDCYEFSNKTKHVIRDEIAKEIKGLVICKYKNDSNYYLFGCDENWNSITDTLHESIEDAVDQAEFEYLGTKDTWVKK